MRLRSATAILLRRGAQRFPLLPGYRLDRLLLREPDGDAVFAAVQRATGRTCLVSLLTPRHEDGAALEKAFAGRGAEKPLEAFFVTPGDFYCVAWPCPDEAKGRQSLEARLHSGDVLPVEAALALARAMAGRLHPYATALYPRFTAACVWPGPTVVPLPKAVPKADLDQSLWPGKPFLRADEIGFRASLRSLAAVTRQALGDRPEAEQSAAEKGLRYTLLRCEATGARLPYRNRKELLADLAAPETALQRHAGQLQTRARRESRRVWFQHSRSGLFFWGAVVVTAVTVTLTVALTYTLLFGL